MSKAFAREVDHEEDDSPPIGPALTSAAPQKNYLTPKGYALLRAEWSALMDVERPQIVEVVHWAAGNGDRSENGDYLYGKKRLREIDRRIRYLTKRLESAEVVDASVHQGQAQVFFGATVVLGDASGLERTVTIVGIDEVDFGPNRISWISPMARALLRAHVDDEVVVETPAGRQCWWVLSVGYPSAALNPD